MRGVREAGHRPSEDAVIFDKPNFTISDTIINKHNTTFLMKIENYEKIVISHVVIRKYENLKKMKMKN